MNLKNLEKKNYQTKNNFRADIVDKNGIIIARNIDIYSAGVRPNLIKDKEKFLINLRLIFPDLKINKIINKLNKKNFFYLEKRLTEKEKTSLFLLGDKAIVFEKKKFRFVSILRN